MNAVRPTPSLWLFPIAVAALALIELWIAQRVDFATADIVALAVTVDVVAGIPLLGYFFFVRTRRARVSILAPLFLLALLFANLILPETGERYLNGIERLFPFLEIGLLLYALTRARIVLQAYREIRPDKVYPTDALEKSLLRTFGDSPVIGILLTELSLLYFAFGGWFARYAPIDPSQRPFSYHVKSGYGVMAGAIIGLSLVEIPLVHLVVNNFSATAAWVVTILTLYTVVWLIGDYHAIRLHPIVLDNTHLHLRAGMRWRVSVPRSQIRMLRHLSYTDPFKKGALDLSVIGNARLLIELNEAVTIHGLFGIRRTADKIAFMVDDERQFLASFTVPGG